MLKDFKPWLQNIERINRNLVNKNSLRLDKSERIDEFPIRKFQQFIKSIDQQDFIIYPDTIPFKEKLAKFNNLELENIYISYGSDQIIKSVFDTFLINGNNIVTTDPCFPIYDIYAQLSNCEIKKVKYKKCDHYYILDVIMEINKEKTSLVVLANPNNPVGDYKDEYELNRLFEFTNKIGIPVLIDEAYYEFSPGTLVHLIKKFDNLIISRTFSKAMGGAGIRLGYLLGNKDIIQKISKFRPMYDTCGITMKFAEFILDNYNDFVKTYVGQTKTARHNVYIELSRAGFDVINSHTNWVHFNNKNDNEDVVKILNNYNVLYKCGTKIPLDDRKNWIRLTVGPYVDKYDFFKEILLLNK